MDTETKEQLMRDDWRREIIRQCGYEIYHFIEKGGNGYVYAAGGWVYGARHDLAIKFIERETEMPEEFKISVQSEFEEGRAMAELGVGIPVYDAHYGNDYGIIVMERGTPVGFDILDRSYFREVFKKIDAINRTGNWCVDYKSTNTVMWKDKPFLIDFDQKFCDKGSEGEFWNLWENALEHYKIEEPDNLYSVCGIDPNNLEHVRDEFRGPDLKMFLAQCYLFFENAKLDAHRVSGYIPALHEIIYKTWADKWRDIVNEVMKYLTPDTRPTRRRQHIRSRRRK